MHYPLHDSGRASRPCVFPTSVTRNEIMSIPPEVELRLSGDLFDGNPRGLLALLGLYGLPMGDNRWMVRPNEEKSFFRSFDLADETGSPGKSVGIGDSSNTETDARL